MRRYSTIVGFTWVCWIVSCSPLDTPRLLSLEADAGSDAGEAAADSAVEGQRDPSAADGGRREPGARAGGGKPAADGGRVAAAGAMAGGAAGQSGSSGPAALMLEPCTQAGALRCALSGAPGARERCTSGTWQTERACAKEEVCSDRPQAGTCQPLAAVCKGSAGKTVCDSAGVMYDCDEQGVASNKRTCKSARHCQPGVEKRACLMCIPGEFRCQQTELERCADDGQSFALVQRCGTSALCNAVAGDCTTAACNPLQFVCQTDQLRQCNADQTALMDVAQCQPDLCDAPGQQCDVCNPGAKGCDGNVVMTCNAQGQDSSREPCPEDKSHCVGTGQCVQCAEADDCPDPGPCKVRYCNQGAGTCAPWSAVDGAACTSALLSGTCKSGGCDLCAPNPCQNGGTCSATAAAVSCACAPGYSGTRCEVDPCSPNPCQNGGVCAVTASGAACTCTGGYAGARCEVDGCAPNPCQNGGTCARTSGGGHTCTCVGGYTGTECQIDACAPNPCQRGGACTRTSGGGHSCTCVSGYSGANCETDPCVPNPCPAGVACTRTASGASCTASCSPSCDVGSACVTGAECRSGVCTNNWCACANAMDCTQLSPGECQVAACSSGSCELQPAAPGATCRTNGKCNATGTCEYCGDGTINGAEECEPAAAGWSSETCGTDCRRRVYKACTSDADCEGQQYCLLNVGICTSACTSESASPAASTDCPPNPLGPEPRCFASACILPCTTGSECPAGVQTCNGFTTDVYSVCGNPPPP